MNARAEAFVRLGGRYETRVLEPSPPAVTEPPWFADDPVARGDVPPGRQVVSPVGTGDIRWEDLAREHEDLREFCVERWLGPYRRLDPAPANLVSTRLALHRLAERVISPARRKSNGEIGLRYTRGGFGTPFFGDDMQIRVDRDQLVVQRPGMVLRAHITTLDAAADHIGRKLLPNDVQLGAAPLEVDGAASAFLGEWYGFAASVLEELRAEAGEALDPSRVQLWPEHFDLALELGRNRTPPTPRPTPNARAAYGCSPGDELHDEPHIYVAPWVAPPPGELWQATGFIGAFMPFAELLHAPDQRAAALEFFRTRLAALTG
jgi:hypothetical protein